MVKQKPRTRVFIVTVIIYLIALCRTCYILTWHYFSTAHPKFFLNPCLCVCLFYDLLLISTPHSCKMLKLTDFYNHILEDNLPGNEHHWYSKMTRFECSKLVHYNVAYLIHRHSFKWSFLYTYWYNVDWTFYLH